MKTNLETVRFLIENLNDMICSGDEFFYEILDKMKEERPDLYDEKGYIDLGKVLNG